MKKKICFPSNSSVSGGSNNSTLIIAKMLQDDYHVQLVYPNRGAITDKIDEETTLDYHIIPLKRKSSVDRRDFVNKGVTKKMIFTVLLIPYFIKVFFYLRRNDFDLVHTNDLQSTLIWGMAAKLNAIKVVWHVRQMKSSKLLDAFRLWVSNHLIFVAFQNRSKFGDDTLKKKKHSVIHNCVDLNKFSGEEGNQGELKNIAYISHLVKRKQPEMFLKACDILSKKYSDLEFVIAGEDLTAGKYLSMIEEYQNKEHLKGRLQYLGYVNQVHQLLKSVDLLIFTSKADGEAFPRIIIEAMACSIPVISTRSAGAIESVHDNETGFLFDGLDDLIQKFDILKTDKELTKKFAKNSRIIAKQKFDCQQYKHKIELVYKEIWTN